MSSYSDPSPGVYRHYKGGLYRVMGLAMHHETREKWVIYVSLAHGSVNTRPLNSNLREKDGWTDKVKIQHGDAEKSYIEVQRFVRIADDIP